MLIYKIYLYWTLSSWCFKNTYKLSTLIFNCDETVSIFSAQLTSGCIPLKYLPNVKTFICHDFNQIKQYHDRY